MKTFITIKTTNILKPKRVIVLHGYAVRFVFFAIIPGVVLLGILRYQFLPKGLSASYYDNPEWKGIPIYVRQEQDVTLRGYQQFERDAQLPSTYFSIAWQGWLWIDENSSYKFMTCSDDGSSVMLDGQLVVDNGGFHGEQRVKKEIFLKKGFHQISINYFNGEGISLLSFQMAKDRDGAPDEAYSLDKRCFSHLRFFDRVALRFFLRDERLLHGVIIILLEGLLFEILLYYFWLQKWRIPILARKISYLIVSSSLFWGLACVTIIFLSTPVTRTLIKLKDSALYALHHFTLVQSNLSQPNSGQEILPSQVQEMLSLLHAHNITSYQLSEQLQQDILILQRITESAWPIRREDNAVYHLQLVDEIDCKNGGIEIDRQKEVALVYCPF